MSAKAIVVVVGSAGRMGARVVRMLADHPTLELGGTVDRGDDAARVIVGARVVIDFSAPAACTQVAPLCVEAGAAYVVASTALASVDEAAITSAIATIPVLQAANLSIGINVLAELVTAAAERLGDFDIEITEIHHKLKRDAPSGTALMLGAAAREGRAGLRDVIGRTGMRMDDELGYAAVRGGDVSGEHTVYFFGDGERLELTHRATTRDVFAHGALAAATWLVGRPAGRYTMRDVLRV